MDGVEISIILFLVVVSIVVVVVVFKKSLISEEFGDFTMEKKLKTLDEMILKEPSTRVAIVSMMRDQKDVDKWLNYHMIKGVHRFYLRVETLDAEHDPIVKKVRSYPQVVLKIGDPNKTPTSREGDLPGQRQMLRQREWLTEAIQLALDGGIDWLVHIDSDELLDCEGLVGDAISEDAKPDTQTMVIRNFEALYGREKINGEKSCFTYEAIEDCEKGSCSSYANGKSVGRVSPHLREGGVHRFRYENGNETRDNVVYMSSLRIVHFESCDFRQYMDKFLKLASSEKLSFPFPYYNESIKVAKACNEKTKDSCRGDFEKIYTKYRVV